MVCAQNSRRPPSRPAGPFRSSKATKRRIKCAQQIWRLAIAQKPNCLPRSLTKMPLTLANTAQAGRRAVLGDEEGCRQSRGNGPQGASLAALLPAGGVVCLRGWSATWSLTSSAGVATASLTSSSASLSAPSEISMPKTSLRRPTARRRLIVVARQQPDKGRQSRFAHAPWHAGRQRCTCDGTAIAGHAVQAPFSHNGHHRRHVHRLVAPRIGIGPRRKILVASSAGLGETVDRRLGGRQQYTLRSLVPRLSASRGPYGPLPGRFPVERYHLTLRIASVDTADAEGEPHEY